jgi:hypothetical protein
MHARAQAYNHTFSPDLAHHQAPAAKRALPPIGESEFGQILWSLIHTVIDPGRSQKHRRKIRKFIRFRIQTQKSRVWTADGTGRAEYERLTVSGVASVRPRRTNPLLRQQCDAVVLHPTVPVSWCPSGGSSFPRSPLPRSFPPRIWTPSSSWDSQYQALRCVAAAGGQQWPPAERTSVSAPVGVGSRAQ